MITVLFSAYCTHSSHKRICEGIIDLLETNGYKVSFFSNSVLNKDRSKILLDDMESTHPDIIISFNKKGYRYIRSILKKCNIPHIYISCVSDFGSEFIYDLTLFDHAILIRDEQKPVVTTFLRDFITLIDLPFRINNLKIDNLERNNSQILVSISSLEALLQIVSSINILSHHCDNILVITNSSDMKFLLNPSIKCLKEDQVDILEQINQSKLIIGDKNIIIEGLLLKKTCVVVGEKGLGGLVDKDNVIYQYTEGFNGRLGAQKEEYIPSELALEYIKKGIAGENAEEFDNIYSLLEIKFNNLFKILDNIINSTISLKSNILDIKLKKNDIFRYHMVQESKTYLVTNYATSKILFSIDEEVFEVINLFQEPITAREVMVGIKYENLCGFENFIIELITNKLIYNNEIQN